MIILDVLASLPVMILSVGSGIYRSVFLVFSNPAMAPLSVYVLISYVGAAARWMSAMSGSVITSILSCMVRRDC